MKKLILLIGFNVILITAFPQWQQVNNGLYGGNADCLVASGNNLFAGNNHAGVFLSKDNGENWSKINTGLTSLNFRYIQLATSGSSVFVATYPGGLFRSNNNGISWEEVNNGVFDFGIAGIGTTDTNIFIYGSSSYLSTNNGTSWKELKSLNSIFESYGLSSEFVSDKDIFVGTAREGNIYHSSDNGETWNQIATKLTEWDINSIIVVDNNIIVGSEMGGLFLSNNNGETWTKVNSLHIYQMITDGSKILAATTLGVYSSIDNGMNWTKLDYIGLVHNRIRALAKCNGKLFAATEYGGVYVSDDEAKKWTRVNNGYTAFNITSVKVSGPNLFAGTYGGDVFLSKDDGQNWKKVMSAGDFGLLNFVIRDIEVSNVGLYVAATDLSQSAIFFSSSAGNTWTKLTSFPSIPQIFSIVISGSNIFAATYQGIFYSNDNCQSWKDLSYDLTRGPYLDVALSGTDIFTAGHNDVSISSNNGKSWTNANSGITTPWINTFLVVDTTVFAGTWGRGIFRYSKQNAKWEEINTGITSLFVYAFTNSGSYLFAGTGDSYEGKEGVFMSINNGTNWFDIDNGLVNNVRSLTVSDEFLYAATVYDGIWRRPLAEIPTSIDQSKSSNLLFQIFPNPSKDGIFQIENISINKTEISIYDVNSKLLYKTYISGKEIKQIDLSDKTKGVYFVRLLNEKLDSTEKLIIE